MEFCQSGKVGTLFLHNLIFSFCPEFETTIVTTIQLPYKLWMYFVVVCWSWYWTISRSSS